MRELDLLVPSLGAADAGTGPAPVVRGLHRTAYTRWDPDGEGRAGLPPLVCGHGFARNGRDFDVLAAALCRDRVVACPDFPGRGRSDWIADTSPGAPADAGYQLNQYVVDALALVARLGVPQVDWLGTSMGGLVGLVLAALPGSPVRRLVLNDVGITVPGSFLEIMAGYIGKDESFADVDAVDAYLRTTYAGFGALTDEQWHHLAVHSSRRRDDGTLGLGYDPAIARSLRPPFTDVDLSPLWAAVRCPVLVLRGEHSPVLSRQVTTQMASTGPRAHVVEIAGVGHAPALMDDAQIGLVAGFLSAP